MNEFKLKMLIALFVSLMISALLYKFTTKEEKFDCKKPGNICIPKIPELETGKYKPLLRG